MEFTVNSDVKDFREIKKKKTHYGSNPALDEVYWGKIFLHTLPF